MPKFKTELKAFDLLMKGQKALCEVEKAGVRIDVDQLERSKKDVDLRITELREKMFEDKKVWSVWVKEFGEQANLASHDQLGTVLFDRMGLKSAGMTASGKKHRTDKDALEVIALTHEFIRDFRTVSLLEKVKSTYLKGIERELVRHADGHWYVHPSYNLNIARSFRTSSDKPNFQNFPIRNDEVAYLIRKCVVASPGNHFIEVDFSQIEVRVAACYSKDPQLIKYLSDSESDMHLDAAKDIYFLKTEEVSKHARYAAKNQFVFPQFYGSVFFQCAPFLWDSIGRLGLRLPDGTPLSKHLKRNGITRLGDCSQEAHSYKNQGKVPPQGPDTFVSHLQKVQEKFWKRLKVYDATKKRWVEEYRRDGGMMTFTGFAMNGVKKRNEINNYRVQCLTGSSKVETDKGWFPIKELAERRSQFRVNTGQGWAQATAFPKGSSRRAIVRLESGLTVRCDVSHRLRNEMDEWVGVKSLKKGNWVALPKVPEVIEPSNGVNFLFLLGFIMGDGSLPKKRDHVNITVGELKKPILQKIKDYLVTQLGMKEGERGGVHWTEIHLNNPRHATQYRLRIGGREFVELMESWGMKFGWKAHSKRIPKQVWESDPQSQRDFMEGLWLSDGSRGRGQEKYLHMCNKNLLGDVQVLIGPMGYDSKICKTSNGWLLRVSCRKFNAKSHRKYPVEALLRQVKSVNKENYTKSSIEYITDSRSFGSATRGIAPSQYVAERIIEKNCPNPKTYRYDRVKSVKILDKEEEVYTLSVDHPLHQYVAEGIIHKNCDASQCKLKAVYLLVNHFRRNKMESRVVGEVHDSILMDVPPGELQETLSTAHRIMTREVPKGWDWVIVPLETESDVSPVGGSWHDKAQWVQNSKGVWRPKQ